MKTLKYYEYGVKSSGDFEKLAITRLELITTELLYFRAVNSDAMEQHSDARRLADVARILLDCRLRQIAATAP